MFPETGVVAVQIEDEAELSSLQNSELGLDDERITWPVGGGFAEILVVTLFFLTLTEHGSEDLERVPTRESTQLFGGGVVSEGSVSDCSISLVSHGLAAIQRSNQLQPQMFLSTSWFLRMYMEGFVREFGQGVDLHSWEKKAMRIPNFFSHVKERSPKIHKYV